MGTRSQIHFRYLAVLIAYSFVANAGELPPKLESAITKAKDKFANEYQAAKEGLGKAFDSVEEDLRKNPKLNSQQLLDAIKGVELEKGRFDKHGRMPLSQPMRLATLAYLKRVKQAEKDLGKAYEPAIKHYLKNKKDEENANELTAQRTNLLAPATLAVVHRLDNDVTWTLKSDGSAGPGRTWTITDKDFTVNNNGFEMKCVVQANGIDVDGVGVDGKTFKAKIVEP